MESTRSRERKIFLYLTPNASFSRAHRITVDFVGQSGHTQKRRRFSPFARRSQMRSASSASKVTGLSRLAPFVTGKQSSEFSTRIARVREIGEDVQ
jgi:hypothetical protein